ncbi:MAG TPA: UbiD family decarboxylase [Thermoguttaceae bacterium]|nr:UbiD family decarboxylase [Thermoguttaceae bacterium]
MSYRCLADFLEDLGHAGELVRVEAEVETGSEVAEITGRIASSGGPALLFGAVAGHEFPLLTNLLGTHARICRALGVASLDETAERIARLAAPAEPEGWFEKIKTAPHAAALAKLPPRRVRSGAAQQIVRLGSDVDLGELPVSQSAPNESGGTITASIVFTSNAESRRPIAGRYDLRVLGPDRLAVGWAAHDEPARALGDFARLGEKMPLAVVLGGDPAILLAACAPLPPGADVGATAGLFREKPIEVVTCRSIELEVPAEAEIVIEGYVDPSEPPAEAGPWSAPLGHNQPGRPVPVMYVTAITHRANPIYPAIVPGKPPDESCIITQALARIFLPLAKMAISELVDYDLPTFGAGRHWAAISIRKTYAGQAHRVADAAWGLRQLMFAKVLVVVDEGIDVHDQQQVLRAIATNVHPARDVFFRQGPPDPFDAATPSGQLGHRMGIDATAKLPGEHPGTWPQPVFVSEEIRKLVRDRWAEYGLGPEP